MLRCVLWAVVAAQLAMCASGAQVARSFYISNFTSRDLSTRIFPSGGVTVSQDKLQMTSGLPRSAGAAYFTEQVWLDEFTLEVSFQFTNLMAPGHDGITIIFQGAQQGLVGPYGAGLGYGSTPTFPNNGIPQSLAIEVDTFTDPVVDAGCEAPHISFHSRGMEPNSAVESEAQLVCERKIQDPRDNAIHSMKIVYTNGTFEVHYDRVAAPLISTKYDMVRNLGLEDSRAWLGFTASTSDTGDSHYITKWSFQYHADLDPARTVQTGVGPVTAGAKTTITLQTYDVYGHPYDKGGAQIAVSTTEGDPVVNPVVDDHQDGTYTVSYELRTAKLNQLQVTVNEVPISGSPFGVQVAPAAVDAAKCVASGGGLTSAFAGTSTSFQIVTKDAFGNVNPAPDTVFSIRAAPTDMGAIYDAFTCVNAAGTWTCTYAISRTGEYTLTVFIDQKALGQTLAPLFIVNCAAVGSKSSVDGMATTLVAGTPQTPTLKVRDCEGNVFAAPVDHSFTLTNSATGATFPVGNPPNENGDYKYAYTLVKAGTWVAAVSVNQQNVSTGVAPYGILVTPANLDNANSEIVWATPGVPVKVPSGTLVQVVLRARDQYGNRITSNAEPMDWAYEYTFGETKQVYNGAKLDSNGVGEELLSASFNLARTYTLAATLNKVPVINSGQFQVVVSPGAFNMGQLLVQGAYAQAESGQENFMWVTLRDLSDNNILEDLGLKISIENSNPKGKDVFPKTDWLRNGTYAVSYTPSSDQYGQFYLTIKVGSGSAEWRGGKQVLNIAGGISGVGIALIVLAVLAVIAVVILVIVLWRRKVKRYQSI